jgi:hypothetical protein
VAARLDSAGSTTWAFGFGSADDETCTDVSVATDGYAYFSGPMTSSFDFSASGVDDLRRPSGAADGWVHRLPVSP